jgi:hypothetical protein
VGLRASLDRCGKSRLTGIRSLDRPARSSVAIPTEIRSPIVYVRHIIKGQFVSVQFVCILNVATCVQTLFYSRFCVENSVIIFITKNISLATH